VLKSRTQTKPNSFLELINNSVSLNKGDSFSVFSFVFEKTEKVYQTLKTPLNYISKHLEGGQKSYSAGRCFFNSLLEM